MVPSLDLLEDGLEDDDLDELEPAEEEDDEEVPLEEEFDVLDFVEELPVFVEVDAVGFESASVEVLAGWSPHAESENAKTADAAIIPILINGFTRIASFLNRI